MGLCVSHCKGDHIPDPRDTEALVGDPTRIGLVGAHGEEERVHPGQPSRYYRVPFICRNLPAWFCIFLQWPISTLVWLIVAGGQFFTGFLYPVLGVRWCYNPSQIFYTHSLYVIWHTVKQTWLGYLCCCGWLVQLQPGVLMVTSRLATPPRFIFDEDSDTAVLLSFSDYAARKKDSFPGFSGRYRAIDGGGNHDRYSFLGQGGRGYAMNEPFMILSILPDADEMATVLYMRSAFKPAAFGNNALCTWFANVAILDFFRSATGPDARFVGGKDKPWVNLHSSYLDLQPLYGWNPEMAASVRALKCGYLKGIAENRLDAMNIVESKAILELFRREHNYVCDELARRYGEYYNTDEKLYQQARLIVGGVYVNVIIRHFGSQMFGEHAPDGEAFAELRLKYGWWPPCGEGQLVGNHATFNFNLIYSWHAGVPAEWILGHVPPSKTDNDLRKILIDALHWRAGGFGPNNTPADLVAPPLNVSARTIRAARVVGAPRLNDFRRRFTYPYSDFLHMCGDPAVAEKVSRFYPTVEDVELVVGCAVERSMQGGWGLGQTVGEAVLCDAFNAIRQDRFYTTDFTPEVYTQWGHQHATSTVLADLLNRHLQLGLDRTTDLAKLPDWAGPPEWSDMQGWPFPQISGFDARGFPNMA